LSKKEKMNIYKECELTVKRKNIFFFSQIYEAIYNKQTNNAYHNAKFVGLYLFGQAVGNLTSGDKSKSHVTCLDNFLSKFS